MANWYGHARTNYVTIVNEEGLLATISEFDIQYQKSHDGKYIFMGNDDSGGWPSCCTDDDGDEIWFDFNEHVVPFMADDEVLIAMEVGNEKLRYVTGQSSAYKKGFQPVYLNIEDVYQKAADSFCCDVAEISQASY